MLEKSYLSTSFNLKSALITSLIPSTLLMGRAVMQRPPPLTKNNIDREMRAYIARVRSMTLPVLGNDIIVTLRTLKRNRVASGPYPDVSLFEAANRIFSDLVIFFGVQTLLEKRAVGRVPLPFSKYEVKLGTSAGNDLTAKEGGSRLVGEAFNVAPSFFQTKKQQVLKRLRQHTDADFLIIVFNAEAVERPHDYLDRSKPREIYLPIYVDESLASVSDS